MPLSGDTEDDAKESIFEQIKWTREMLRQEVLTAMNETGVDEGARGAIWVNACLEPGGIFTHSTIPVSSQAEAEFNGRIEACAQTLRKHGFHVEHFKQPNRERDLTDHRLVVRYEYERRPGV